VNGSRLLLTWDILNDLPQVLSLPRGRRHRGRLERWLRLAREGVVEAVWPGANLDQFSLQKESGR
jgi:hypothetical protein